MKKYIINKIWWDGVNTHSEKLDECTTKREAFKLYKRDLENDTMMKDVLNDDNDVIDAKEWFLATSKTKLQKVMIEIKEIGGNK